MLHKRFNPEKNIKAWSFLLSRNVLALGVLVSVSVLSLSALPIQAIRFATNPLITPQSSPSLGQNINGPSVIRVPGWIANPLGKYYLYFAHHNGLFIRLAYADSLHGAWRIYTPGVFPLSRLSGSMFSDHVASPDVHIDSANQRLLLYFHGVAPNGQKTGVAISTDGLNFTPKSGVQFPPLPDTLGDFYFRVFGFQGYKFAIAKNANIGGELLRSTDGLTPFEKGSELITNMRHSAVSVRGTNLFLFYTKAFDAPERIYMSTMSLSGDWKTWTPSAGVEILRPILNYEGANLPIAPSNWGLADTAVNQLRDPAIFEDSGRVYLFYSIAGEQGIAAAELTGLDPVAIRPSLRRQKTPRLAPFLLNGGIGITLDGRKLQFEKSTP